MSAVRFRPEAPIKYGKFAERPNATDCKSVDYVFGGSNPPLPTIKIFYKLVCKIFYGRKLYENHPLWGPRKITKVILWGKEKLMRKQKRNFV